MRSLPEPDASRCSSRSSLKPSRAKRCGGFQCLPRRKTAQGALSLRVRTVRRDRRSPALLVAGDDERARCIRNRDDRADRGDEPDVQARLTCGEPIYHTSVQPAA